jgi:hypothetical protein
MLYAGIKRMLRPATPHTETVPFAKAKELFLEVTRRLSFDNKMTALGSLLLWARVNIAYAEYFLNNYQGGLDALVPTLESFRSRIRDEPDLQRPFYAGLFNKAIELEALRSGLPNRTVTLLGWSIWHMQQHRVLSHYA